MLRSPALRAATRYFGLSAGGERTPAQGVVRRSTSWRALAGNPAFRWYFAGSVTSDLGSWLANTAQLLLAYRLSHSVLVIGLVTCAQFSSPLLLGPWAGVMTDRHGGRRMLFATQLLGAMCAMMMAALVFAGLISPLWLAGGAIATGLAFTLALPARNVTVRRLVRDSDVEPAFAMDSVSYNLGRAVGPPLTVALVMFCGGGNLGYGWAFAANAVSFLVFAVFLLVAGKGTPQRVGAGSTARSGLKAGLAAARADWQIAVLLAMVAAVTLADDPILVLGPALAREQNVMDGLPHLVAQWLTPASLPGLFIAALGAGTVIGSLRPSRHRAGLRVPAVALAALAIAMMAFIFSRWWWASVAAAAAVGFTGLVANASTRTLLSKRAGPELEASVMALWAIAWAGSKPVASLADGVLADSLGLRWTGLILALPALVPVIVMVVLMVCVYGARRRQSRTVRPPAPRPATGAAHRAAAPGRRTPIPLDRRSAAALDWVETLSLDAFDRASELLRPAEREQTSESTGPRPAIIG